MLNRKVKLQEKVGSNYVMTDNGEYVATVPEQDWRDEVVRRWNIFEGHKEDVEDRLGRYKDEVGVAEGRCEIAENKLRMNQLGVAKALSLAIESRERLMTGEDDDNRLDDLIRILGALV
jgi:hypothetical protein